MVQHYYRNVHAVVFVYDITKRSSFDNLRSWLDECDANNLGPDVPRVLVGNKCDLPSNMVSVQTSEAQRFADACGMPLFETSAKDHSACNHVEAIFMTLAHKLHARKPMMSPAVQSIGMTRRTGGRVLNLERDSAGREDEVSSSCFC